MKHKIIITDPDDNLLDEIEVNETKVIITLSPTDKVTFVDANNKSIPFSTEEFIDHIDVRLANGCEVSLYQTKPESSPSLLSSIIDDIPVEIEDETTGAEEDTQSNQSSEGVEVAFNGQQDSVNISFGEQPADDNIERVVGNLPADSDFTLIRGSSVDSRGFSPVSGAGALQGSLGNGATDAEENQAEGETVIQRATQTSVRTVREVPATPAPDPNLSPIAGDDTGETDQNTPVSIDIIGNDSDPDGDAIVGIQIGGETLVEGTPVSLSSGGSVTLQNDGTISYDPSGSFDYLPDGATAIDTFEYTIVDERGATGTALVSVTVNGLNDAPSANDDDFTVTEDNAEIILVLDNDSDPDGDAISVESFTQPSSGAIVTNNNDGTLTYNPNGLFEGLAVGETAIDTFDYVISDGNGGSSTATATVTIEGVNDAPEAADDSENADEDAATILNLLGNDTDIDGDNLFISHVNGNAVSSGDSIALSSGVELTLLADGTVEFNPNGVYDGLEAGATAIETFSYTISDGNGGTDIATATVTIDGTNDGPQASDDFENADEDTTTTLNLLGNDLDIDGDDLSITHLNGNTVADGDTIALTSGVEITLQADGTVEFNPNGIYDSLAVGATAIETFSYTISDGNGGTDIATATVTIDGSNDGPQAVADTQNADEDVTTIVDLLGNDLDIDGDILTVTQLNGNAVASGDTISLGSGAEITLQADGTVEFDPNDAYATLAVGDTAVESFSYTISDGNGGTSTATATLTISGANDAPDAVDDIAAATAEFAVDVTVLLNDSDPDNDTLSIVSVTPPSSGALVTSNVDGTINYDPNGQFDGLGLGITAVDTFSYTISDGNGGTDTATVNVTITGVNNAPIAVDDVVNLDDFLSGNFNPLDNDLDPDGDLIAITEIGGVPVEPGEVINILNDSVATLLPDGTINLDIVPTPDEPIQGLGGILNPIAIDLDGDGVEFRDIDNGIRLDVDGDGQVEQVAWVGNDDGVLVLDSDNNGDLSGVSEIEFSALSDDPNATDLEGLAELDTNQNGLIDAGDDQFAEFAVWRDADGDGVVDSGEFQSLTDLGIESINLASDSQSYSAANGDVTVHGTTEVRYENGAVVDAADSSFNFEEIAPSVTELEALRSGLGAGESATAIVEYTISDPHGLTDTATITILIEGENDAPIANPDTASVSENSTVDITVLTNDIDLDTTDTITLESVDQPASGAIVSANVDGTVNYDTNGQFDSLDQGETATDQFTYTVTDESGATSSSTVTVTITGENDAPTAVNDTATVAESSEITIDALANDTDVDSNATISITSFDQPTSGAQVTQNVDGTFNYNTNGAFGNLNPGETAIDSFSYVIEDEFGVTSTATVTVTVEGENQAPTANTETVNVNENDTETVNVLANDTDGDPDDILEVQSVSQPASGAQVTNNGDGTVSYDTNGQFESLSEGETATDSFTYTVSDGNGGTDTATVNVIVTGENDAPVASEDAVTTDEDNAADFDLLSNDTDAEGDDLTITSVSPPASGGSTSINPNGTVNYDPNGSFDYLAVGETATDTFSYTIEDENGAESTAQATVTITGVNDAPDTNPDDDSTDENLAVTIDVLGNDVDIDLSDVLSITDLSDPISNITDGIFDNVTGTLDGLLDTTIPGLLGGVTDTLDDLLGGITDTLSDTTGPVLDLVNGTIDDLLADIPNLIGDLINDLPTDLDGISDAVNQVVGDVTSQIDQVVTDLLDNTIPNLVSDLTDGLPIDPNGITGPLGTALDDISTSVNATVDDLVNNVLPGLVDDMVSDLTDGLNATSDGVTALVGDIGTAATAAVTDVLANVTGDITDATQPVAGLSDAISDAVNAAVNDLVDDQLAGIVDGALASLPADLTDAGQPAQAVASAVTDAVNAAVEDLIANAVPQILSDVTGELAGDVAGIGGSVADNLDAINSIVNDAISDVLADSLPSVLNGVNSVVTSVLTDATGPLTDAVGGVTTALNDAVGTFASETVPNLVSDVTGDLANSISAVTDPLPDSLSGITDGANAAIDSLVNTDIADAVTSITDSVQTDLTGVSDTITGTLNGVQSTVDTAIDGIVGDVIGGIIGNIGDILLGGGPDFNALIADSLDGLSNTVGATIEDLNTNVLPDALGDVASGLTSGIDGTLDPITGALTGISDGIAGGVTGVIDGLPEGFEDLTDPLSGALTGISDAATGAVSDISSNLPGTLNNLNSGVTDALNAATTPISDATDGLNSVLDTAIANALADAIPDALGDILGDILNLDPAAAAVALADALAPISDSLTSAITDVTGNVLPSEITDLTSGITDNVSGTLGAISTSVEAVGTAANAATSDLLDNTLPTITTAILDGVTGDLSGISTSVTDLAGNLTNDLNDLTANTIPDALSDISSDLTGAINSILSSVDTTLTGVVDGATGLLDGLTTDVLGSLNDLVTGVVGELDDVTGVLPGALNVITTNLTGAIAGILSGDGLGDGALAILNPDGTVTYDPNGAFAALAPGETAIDTFTYLADDGNGGSALETVTVTIVGQNFAPTANDDFVTLDEFLSSDFNPLANDTDPDGDTLVISGIEDITLPTGLQSLPDAGSIIPGSGGVLNPIGIDLDGNGVQFVNIENGRDFDADNDGVDEQIAWVGNNDGILVYDLNGDGTLSGVSEIKLSSLSGDENATDLDGLATLDTNNNGLFDAGDDSFADFAVYQDADGDGVVDFGEFRTLEEQGIESINLTSDEVTYTDADGDVVVYGTTEVTFTDGSVNDGADAGFSYGEASPFSEDVEEIQRNLGAGETEIVEVDYTITDPYGLTDTATIFVTIIGQNDAPIAVNDAAAINEDGTIDIAVLDNDIETDVNDTLTISNIDQPASGASVTLNVDGSLNYDPNGQFIQLAMGETAIDTFVYTITDGGGETSSATVSVTVTGNNEAPVANDDQAGVNSSSQSTIDVLANDTDADFGDEISVINLGPTASGASISVNGDGTISYDPDGLFDSLGEGETAIDTFNYTISDNNGSTSSATVTVTIGGENSAPVALNDIESLGEDGNIDIDVLENDSDPDGNSTLVVTNVSATVAGGTASLNGDGTVNYDTNGQFESLAHGETAVDSFSYTISDGVGGSASATVQVTINGVNDGPTAGDNTGETSENATATISVLANDTDPDSSDTLTVISTVAPASGALATINGDGTITYDPNGQFEDLAPGATAIDTFSYTVSDGNGGTDTATVTLTINGQNDPPIAVNDVESTTETDAVIVDVLENDSDAEGDSLTISSVVQPSSGASVTITGDNQISYDPNGQFEDLGVGATAIDTFSYVVEDGRGGSESATVTVTITGVNDGPTANNDTASVSEDGSVAVAVMANDTDIDGDPIRVLDTTASGSGATLTINLDGTVEYDSNGQFESLAQDETAIDSFSYTITDTNNETSTATVQVTINGVNDGPSAGDDTAGTSKNATATIAVLANDSDPDGSDTLTVIDTVDPVSGAQVTINGDGTITYDPNGQFAALAPNATAVDTFSYTVSDGNGGTDTATVTLTISGANDSPIAVSDVASTTEENSVIIDVLDNDTDADGNDLSIASVVQPTSGASVSITGDNQISYDPNGQFEDLAHAATATDTFSYVVEDGRGGSDTTSVTVTITGTNDGPVANNDTTSVSEDSNVDVAVMVNDTDIDGDPIRVLDATASGSGAEVTVNLDGTVNYDTNGQFESLAANETAIDTFTYTITDTQNATSTATVQVTINGVNDGPSAGDDTGSTSENATATISVLANDSDPDASDTLTVIDTVAPASGALVTINGDGTITYDPNGQFEDLAPGESALDSFSYTISDGNGGTDTATVTLTINGQNDPPIAVADVASTTEDNATVIDVLDNDSDADGDTLTIASVVQPASGATVTITGDNQISYNPNGQFDSLAASVTAIDTFSYVVEDGRGGSETATVTVTITGTNDGPVALADNGDTDEDTAFAIDVLANDSDVDGGTLAVTNLSATASGALVSINGDGTVQYDPNGQFESLAAGVTAIDTFTYTVEDGQGSSATQTVTVTITGTNDGPVALADNGDTDEDTAFSIDVLANDSDVDGGTLAVTNLSATASGALVSINGDGTVQYDPNGQFESLAAGVTAIDTFTYTVEDGQGSSATQTVTVTITGTNDGPVANNDTTSVSEDSNVDVAVMVNDTDIDGDPIRVLDATASGSGAEVTVNLDGTVNYDANGQFESLAANETAIDTFTYTITDTQNATSTATVQVTINGVNDGPSAGDDTGSTSENATATISVLANDSDPDASDTLTVIDTVAPASGALVTINGDGTITYDPNGQFEDLAPGESALDSFSYTISDGNGGTDTATVTLTINGQNDPPIAVADVASTNEDNATVIDVLDNDSDADGDTLTIASVVQPASGATVTITGDNQISYNPNGQFESLAAGVTAIDTFSYVVEDGRGGSETATVTVTITGTNDGPVALADNGDTDEDTAFAIDVLANDSDVDGGTLAVTNLSATASGALVSINGDGTVQYDPNGQFESLAAGVTAIDTFTYTVEDGQGSSATQTVTVTITGTNDGPVANSDVASVDEDSEVTIDAAANDTDPDGDTLTITDVDQPASGAIVSINVDGTLNYDTNGQFESLAEDATAIDTFTYTIDDGNGGSATATATVTITGVNDDPDAIDDSESVNDNEAVVIAVLNNDTDIDGDDLNLFQIEGQDVTPGDTITLDSGAQVTVNADGTVTYEARGDSDQAGLFDIVNNILGAVGGLVPAVGDLVTDLTGGLPDLNDLLTDPVPDLPSILEIVETILDDVTGLIQQIDPVVSNLTDNVPDVGDLTADLDGLLADLTASVPGLNDLIASLVADPTDLPQIVSDTTAILPALTALLDDATDVAQPALTGLIADLTSAVADLDVAPATVALVNDTVDDVSILAPALTNLSTVIGTATTALESGDIDGLIPQVIDLVAGILGVNGPLEQVLDATTDFSGLLPDTGDIVNLGILNDELTGLLPVVNNLLAELQNDPQDLAAITSLIDENLGLFQVLGNFIIDDALPAVNSLGVELGTLVAALPDELTIESLLTGSTDAVAGLVVDVGELVPEIVNSLPILNGLIPADGDVADFTNLVPTLAPILTDLNDTIDVYSAILEDLTDQLPQLDGLIPDGAGILAGLESTLAELTGVRDGVVNLIDGANTLPPDFDQIESDLIAIIPELGDVVTALVGGVSPTLTNLISDLNDALDLVEDLNPLSETVEEVIPTVSAVATTLGTLATALNGILPDPENPLVIPNPLDALPDLNDSIATITDALPAITGLIDALNADIDGLTQAVPDVPGIVPDLDEAVLELTGLLGSLTGLVDDIGTIPPDLVSIISDTLTLLPSITDTLGTVTGLVPDLDDVLDALNGVIDSLPDPTALTDTIFAILNDGESATDTFTYTIDDGNGGTDIATVSINVSGVNDDPGANDDDAETTESAEVTIDVLANDNDPEGGTLTVTSVIQPTSGAVVTINGDGTVTYNPNGNFEFIAVGETAIDTFEYVVSDENGGSEIARVNVTLTGENDDPTAAADAGATTESTDVDVDVLANDFDTDATDVLSVASVTQPVSGGIDGIVDILLTTVSSLTTTTIPGLVGTVTTVLDDSLDTVNGTVDGILQPVLTLVTDTVDTLVGTTIPDLINGIVLDLPDDLTTLTDPVNTVLGDVVTELDGTIDTLLNTTVPNLVATLIADLPIDPDGITGPLDTALNEISTAVTDAVDDLTSTTLPTLISDLVTTLSGTLNSATGSITGLVEDISDAATVAVTDALANVSGDLDNATAPLGDLTDTITLAVETAVNDLVADDVPGIVAAVLATLPNDLGDSAEPAQNIISAVTDAVNLVVTDLVDTIVPQIVTDVTSDLGTDVGALATPISDDLTAITTAISDSISSITDTALPTVLAGLNGTLATALAGTNGPITTALDGILTTVTDTVGTLTGTTVPNLITDVVADLTTTITGVTDPIPTALVGVTDGVEAAVDTIVTTDLPGAITAITDDISTDLGGVTTVVETTLDGVDSTVTTTIDTLVTDTVTGLLGNLLGFLGGGGLDVTSVITNSLNNLSGDVDTTVNNLTTTVLPGAVTSVTSDLTSDVTGIATPVTTALNDIATALGVSVDDIINGLPADAAELTDPLSTALDGISTETLDLIATLTGTTIPDSLTALNTGLTTSLDAVVDPISDASQEVSNTLDTAIADVLTNALPNLIPDLLASINLLDLGGTTTALTTVLTNALTPISTAVSAEVATATDTVLATEITDLTTDLTTDVNGVVAPLTGAVNSLTTGVDAIVTEVTDTTVPALVNTILSGVTGDLMGLTTAVTDAINTTVTDLTGDITTLSTATVPGAISSITTGLIDDVNAILASVDTTLDGTLDTVGLTVTDLVDDISDLLTNLVSDVTTELDSVLITVPASVSTIITDLTDSVDGLITNIDILGSGAQVTINEDGTVNYDPNGSFDDLGEGETATDTFTYVVEDGNGGTDIETVTITISGENNAPEANNDLVSISQNTSILVDVLGNDVDVDLTDSIRISEINNGLAIVGDGITLASGAEIELQADGTINYLTNGVFDSLAQGQTALDSYVYSIIDNNGSTSVATVEITINGEADAPILLDDEVTIDEDVVTVIDLLANDSDPDTGDSISLLSIDGTVLVQDVPLLLSSGALVTLQADGRLNYDPNGAFESLNNGDTAIDTFVYAAVDLSGETALATVTVNIDGTEDVIPPIALDLNNDGVIEYKTADNGFQFDVDNDGQLEQIAWVGNDDGILVYDYNEDGDISARSEFVLADWTSENDTDLEAMRTHFDSNSDGTFDSLDEEFGRFAIWQDANGNSSVDEGEWTSLLNSGVKFDLESDGQYQLYADGQVEVFGTADFTMANGDTILAADASFRVQEMPAADEMLVAGGANQTIVTTDASGTEIAIDADTENSTFISAEAPSDESSDAGAILPAATIEDDAALIAAQNMAS